MKSDETYFANELDPFHLSFLVSAIRGPSIGPPLQPQYRVSYPFVGNSTLMAWNSWPIIRPSYYTNIPSRISVRI